MKTCEHHIPIEHTCEECQFEARSNPHLFSMGGGYGVPDRPCVICGLPDRATPTSATGLPA